MTTCEDRLDTGGHPDVILAFFRTKWRQIPRILFLSFNAWVEGDMTQTRGKSHLARWEFAVSFQVLVVVPSTNGLSSLLLLLSGAFGIGVEIWLSITMSYQVRDLGRP